MVKLVECLVSTRLSVKQLHQVVRRLSLFPDSLTASRSSIRVIELFWRLGLVTAVAQMKGWPSSHSAFDSMHICD